MEYSEEHLESFSEEEIEKILKAGAIIKEVKKFAKSFIKPSMPLLEIAETIEKKIIELGAKPAFPVNLSINEIAAHATPTFNSEETAKGLLKVDLGCHISGFSADTAFSINLSDESRNPEEYKENESLINAAESALQEAVKIATTNSSISKIGKTIEKTVESNESTAIRNLSGHSISQWNLHSGTTIPNFDNSSPIKLSPGLYAIEPFTTLQNASGLVKEGKLSGIYHLEQEKSVRDSFARTVLDYIIEEYQTLPFCSRWIYNKFGSRGLLALRQIEATGCLHHYPQLIESSGKKVAQAEHTILVSKEKVEITT